MEALKYETMRFQFRNISEEHFRCTAAHARELRSKEEECDGLRTEVQALRGESERLTSLCEQLKEEARALREENEGLKLRQDLPPPSLTLQAKESHGNAGSTDRSPSEVERLVRERDRWKAAHKKAKADNAANESQWQAIIGTLRASLDRSIKESARLKKEMVEKADAEAREAAAISHGCPASVDSPASSSTAAPSPIHGCTGTQIELKEAEATVSRPLSDPVAPRSICLPSDLSSLADRRCFAENTPPPRVTPSKRMASRSTPKLSIITSASALVSSNPSSRKRQRV
jgi:hypothetical protein